MSRKRVGIGSMRHAIEVQESSRERDEFNGLRDTWSTIDGGAVRASIRPATTYERQAYAHDVGGITHVVTIRTCGLSIDTRHRIAWGARILEVRGVLPDDLGRFTTIRCEETVVGGGGSDGV